MKKGYILSAIVFLILLISYQLQMAKSTPTPRPRRKETVASIEKRYTKAVLSRLQSNLSACGLKELPQKICLVAIKDQQELEVYCRISNKWKLFKSYPFTGYSGELGPKLQQGDRQIPEGVYKISSLNPNSSYHLSAKVNYPNAFDKKMGKKDGRTSLGGDIFIHGEDVTIGCIPIGNEAIEELFILLARARKKGVTIVITPRDFRKGAFPPELSHISWEEELYDQIKKELEKIPFDNSAL